MIINLPLRLADFLWRTTKLIRRNGTVKDMKRIVIVPDGAKSHRLETFQEIGREFQFHGRKRKNFLFCSPLI